ncbi:SDR family NAD(P)-dependent oxidoreductase [Bacillus sp. EB600]|uniref:SDR family NAD(P)-dependent oxidoreductase n=1 Tax=Bacillus sp. EB600 TaxID=2806345 RepID=UPI00210F064B|nr:SDR family oxidoreductase [Bacillus sp. EB600]MCQ6279572.1 SDR family oxidoreductase [Bacillus sp. EB600]
MNSSKKLAGRSAIVTGGSKGIGLAIAKRLAEDGADVLLAATSDPVIENAKTIAEEYNVKADYYIGDLSKEEHAYAMVNKAIESFGKVDILVNNAGGGVILPFLEHTAETLKTTLDRNLWTTIWGCKAVLPHMVEKEYGRIINIGGDSVRNGLWNHAGYNAAKGGVHAIVTGLAREFAQYDITANCVAPPQVLTDRKLKADNLRRIDDDLNQKFKSIIPKGRPANMSEVAAVVSFLAADEASFVTGQVISVNGGSTML